MCVIIVKPGGAELPSKEELKRCHLFNPHGMGFASPSVQYKGMSFDTFYRKLCKVPKSEPCIIHFRLATHGSIRRANCHPFNAGDVWFMHNGILRLQPYKDMTDSETAFRFILMPKIQYYGLDSEEVRETVADIIGTSKFAFLQGSEVRTFGDFIKYGECLYSNLRHHRNYFSRMCC